MKSSLSHHQRRNPIGYPILNLIVFLCTHGLRRSVQVFVPTQRISLVQMISFIKGSVDNGAPDRYSLRESIR